MRKFSPFLFVLLFLSFMLSCGVARAQSAIGIGPYGQVYNGPVTFQLAGECSAEMVPDKAVIVGGVSSGGLKPTAAGEQLDMQIGAMRTYVEQNHGQLTLKERVRTLKNPNPNAQPGREDSEPPYLVVQGLRAEFPTNAPVDAILQKLIELGLDRYGDNIVNNYNNRREVVVRYHMSDFISKIGDLQQRCTADAWKTWCTANASVCPSKDPPANLDMQSFNVRSEEPVLRPDGNNVNWQLMINRAQRSGDPPELVGNVPLRVRGTISLIYRQEAPHQDQGHPEAKP